MKADISLNHYRLVHPFTWPTVKLQSLKQSIIPGSPNHGSVPGAKIYPGSLSAIAVAIDIFVICENHLTKWIPRSATSLYGSG